MTARIPSPPALEAEWLSPVEACGLLRVSRAQLNRLRAGDASFPKARVLSKGTARFRRADLVAWIESKPEGWCETGGSRPGAGRRRKAAA
jgi:hypothetical protein